MGRVKNWNFLKRKKPNVEEESSEKENVIK
jgi:hypothetical protein